MKLVGKILLIACILVAGGGFYWWKSQAGAKTGEGAAGKVAKAEGKGAGKRGGGGPVSVRTVPVTRQAMPVVIDAVGTVESEHSVAVRPQVNGVLTAVLFKEGDRVKQGQSLFSVDPRPMQASVDQARSALARDQAQLAQAKEQEARLRPLMEKEYITRNDYDVAATQVKSLEAVVAANRAVLEQAQLQLSYAHIKAPISGRTGSLSVDSGNLVTGGTGGAPLVVINSTQPITVALAVPQRFLEDVRRYWNTPDLKVQISLNPGGPPVAEGALVFIDNTVNPTTGTILLKARFKNEKEELWPGQFVAARIILKVEKDALVLPEGAVQPGQDRPFVYVVRDGKAAMQEVRIARQLGNGDRQGVEWRRAGGGRRAAVADGRCAGGGARAGGRQRHGSGRQERQAGQGRQAQQRKRQSGGQGGTGKQAECDVRQVNRTH
jgi:multidrug efflux system membrane fusion protein